MDLEERCRELFDARRTDTEGALFHAVGALPATALRSWTSAYHALALRHLDPALAQAELETLYASNGLPTGLLSGVRVLGEAAGEEPLALLLDSAGRGSLIAPPVAAYASAVVAAQIGGAARPLLERATLELDAIWAERLPPDTSLPVILHPLESGTAGSPMWDSMVDAEEIEEWLDDLATLARSAAACELDPARALRVGHPFVIEDPVFCGWFLLALEESARTWEAHGEERQCERLSIRTEMIAEAVADRLWWEEEQIFVGWDRGRDQALRAVTAGGLVPLAARSVASQEAARRALDRHLRPSTSSLWSARGISFNPIVADRLPGSIPWRGNVARPEVQHWAHLCLVRGQRVPDARVMRSQLEERILALGFPAGWDPVTGEELLDGPESAPTLCAIALEMGANEQL